MATQTITTAGDIPKILDPYYVGRAASGTPDTEGYKPEIVGLLQRGVEAIYPEGMAGPAGYATQFAPLIQAGLTGAGTIAPMSQFQQALGTQLAGMTSPSQYALAEQAGQAGAAGLQSLMGVQAPSISTPSTFGSEQAAQYMSPYMQNVVDIQQRQAIDAARQAQLGGNLAAARQGTYGGARQALLQAQRESGLRTQLGDIQAQGLQASYDRAAQLFGADRAAQMEAEKANQSAALQAGQTRLGAAQGLGGLAQTFGGLGTQQLASELDILKTQGAYGDLQRSIAQQQMDAQRQSLMDQAQYGQTQVGQLSNLLRGVPLSDTTQQTSTPPPSFASQLTGLGLTGLSLYNLLGNK